MSIVEIVVLTVLKTLKKKLKKGSERLETIVNKLAL